MTDRNLGQRIWLGAVVTALMLLPLSVHAEGPSPADVDRLAEQIYRLEESYLVPAVLQSRFRLEARFNDAKVAYLLGEYRRASILFVAVTDSAEVRQFDSYREALFLLGDSLFQTRSFRAGRAYFRQLVEMGPGPFYQPAIVRLLETAAEIDDYAGVDELYDRLDNIEAVGAAIHYIRGKTLYEQGRLHAARPWFQRAARDEDYAFTARYFEAVSLVGEGDQENAREIFDEISRRTPARQEDRQVVELAHLALGRLAYEQEDYDQAIDHYLQLPRTSRFFDRALYELTWSLIARGSYQAALRNLEILLFSDPDPRFIPEARALMADMSMRLKEYEDARQRFAAVIEFFAPVRLELRRFIESQDNLEEFFLGLVRDDLEGLRPDYLPEIVTEWVEDEALMQASRQLVGDGTITQADIDESYEAIEEIEALLAIGTSIQAFPTLAEGWALGVELEARLVDLHDRLLDWELQQVQPLLGPVDRERLERIEAQLDELRRRESQTPRNRDELRERDRAMTGRFRSLQSELDDVAFEIDGLEETLEGIGQYLRGDHSWMSEEDRVQVTSIRNELQAELDSLNEERRRLSRELDRSQHAFGTRDETLVRQRGLREQMQQLQLQRAEIVDAQSNYLQASQASQALAVAESRRRLPALKRRLDRYFDELDEVVDERVGEIQATLDSERAQLAGYQSELDGWVGRTEETVASIALWNFIKVDQDFDTLVRRGHVGLVDVDWQRLEDSRREYEDLVDHRMATEEMLREAFPDVR